MILGDLGADVIKIKGPGSGDESRRWGPPFDSRGESAYYLCCNRNKMSVAADLDEAHDQALLRRLIKAGQMSSWTIFVRERWRNDSSMFAAMARALGLEALDDPRFATNAGRLAHRWDAFAQV